MSHNNYNSTLLINEYRQWHVYEINSPYNIDNHLEYVDW